MRLKQRFTLSDGSPLTRQENLVLRQVAKGEVADLRKEFGEEEAGRRLRARFLEELLTGKLQGVEVHRRGVRISNGVIEEQLDLENGEVKVGVEFISSIFKELVWFRDAVFQRHLDLNGSHFIKKADFHRIKVEIGLFCHEAVFEGPVNFSAAIIKQFEAVKAKFLVKDQKVSFNGMEVGKDVRFDETEFHGPVNLRFININGQLVAVKTKFLDDNELADFNGITVGQDAHFDGAEFHGPVDFIGANIQGQFAAHGARFLSDGHKADFHGMQVGLDVFLKGCDFYGLVSFVQIKVACNLNLEPLIKFGQELATTFHHDVNLRGADIGGEFLAEKAQFLGHSWVNLEEVKVGRSFHASGAIFGGPVNFSEMKVKRNFYINPSGKIKFFKTLFKSTANFLRTEVDGVFNADQAIFQSESTIFSGLKVGQGAFFIGTIFYGGLVIKEGQLNDLVIRGLHRLSRGGLPLAEIVLNRTKIAHRLTIEDIEVKRFDARNLEVKGPAELRRLFIRDEADLRDAALHHLQIVEIDWPEPQEGRKRVFLDGLAYESITTREEPEKPEAWPKLVAWLGLSGFNTRNYQELDAYLQRGGLRQWADKVYIAGRRRELRMRKWWHPARWLTRFFWGLLAGYGRKPGRVGWISLGLIILGAVVLNPAEVLAPDFLNSLAGYQDNFVHRIALRLIVSLYSLVAAIPGWGGHLSMASPGFHTFVYLWIQRICGWILIPIGLAAVYTRLK